jgi:hypothetical protein
MPDTQRSPAQLTKAERLRMHARPLRPLRPPFYVQHATTETPLMGWYWQPQGAPGPQPLAASYDLALVRIVTLVNGRAA